MRVAHVASYRPQSSNGVYVTVAKLAEHLVKGGDDIEVWHFRRDVDRVGEREESSGVRVIDVPFGALGAVSPHIRYLPRRSRDWIRGRSLELDGLHFHSVFQPESWYIRQLTSIPFGITPNGGYGMYLAPSVKNRLKAPLWHMLERGLLESAEFAHAVTPTDAAAIRTLAPSVPLAVIPNGVDVSGAAISPVLTDAPWLWIGRMHIEKKGLDLLIEGYAKASRGQSLPRLLIRGPDFRGGRDSVNALIRDHHLESKIQVGDETTGNEKERLLSSCSVFFHPSRIEGLPLVILEALGAGRPVAVSPGTNVSDIVAQAGAGFVIEASTPEAVAATMRAASRSTPEELTELGMHARTLAEREFSWPQIARRVHALYEEHFRDRPREKAGRVIWPQKPS